MTGRDGIVDALVGGAVIDAHPVSSVPATKRQAAVMARALTAG